MRYEILIFDADDTLYDYEKAECYALKQVFKDLNLEYKSNYRDIYKKINKQMWLDFEKGLISQEKLKIERFEQFFDELGIDRCIYKDKDIGVVYQKHLADADFLFDETEKVLQGLYKKYKMAIITNGLKLVQEKRIKKHHISKYFEEIVISDEVNMRKPNKDIFDYTLDKLNIKDRSKVLMIGDSLSSDILGGINAGIDTCYINLFQEKNITRIKANYEIAHIKEIYKVLD